VKSLLIANETSLFLFIIENLKHEVLRQLIGDTVNSALLPCYVLLVQAEVHVFAVYCLYYKVTVCPGFSRTVSEIRFMPGTNFPRFCPPFVLHNLFRLLDIL